MGGKYLRKCEVCGIRRMNRKDSKIFLARFPLDPDRCRLWVKLVGNEDLAYLPIQKLNENKFICGKHFLRSDFNKTESRLKRHAIPSVKLNEPLSDEIISSFPYIPEIKTTDEDFEEYYCQVIVCQPTEDSVSCNSDEKSTLRVNST